MLRLNSRERKMCTSKIKLKARNYGNTRDIMVKLFRKKKNLMFIS